MLTTCRGRGRETDQQLHQPRLDLYGAAVAGQAVVGGICNPLTDLPAGAVGRLVHVHDLHGGAGGCSSYFRGFGQIHQVRIAAAMMTTSAADLIASAPPRTPSRRRLVQGSASAVDRVQTQRGSRSALTTIYYLLERGQISRWHVASSDEIWHFYAGAPLELLVYDPETRIAHPQVLAALFANAGDAVNEPIGIVRAGMAGSPQRSRGGRRRGSLVVVVALLLGGLAVAGASGKSTPARSHGATDRRPRSRSTTIRSRLLSRPAGRYPADRHKWWQ